MPESFDLLILSNGVGEITTWVRPVVKAVREQLGSAPRISVVLAPCSHGTGKEAAIARSYPEVDRVQSSKHFWSFLLFGKTADNWSWFKRGIVLFLGGDQVFPLFIGKRLGFKTLIYAEWEARWWRFIDAFAVMNDKVLAKVPLRYHNKFTVVGDLMVDMASDNVSEKATYTTIGLLPGSKSMKLAQGVPLVLAIAEKLRYLRPEIQFMIPVAPTLTLQNLARFADLESNPVIKIIKGQTAQLITEDEQSFFETPTGLKIPLITEFPAHSYLQQCSLCLTTVGANTAELGALGIPMIVLLPAQQIDAMRAWDGLPGIIANLPIIGTTFITWLNKRMLKYVLANNIRYAWPNIWAKREIVPELAGYLSVDNLADLVIDFLDHPEKLGKIRQDLQACRGESGAAKKLTGAIATLAKSL